MAATENGGLKEGKEEEDEVVAGKQPPPAAGPIDPELAVKAEEWKEIANIKFKGDNYY